MHRQVTDFSTGRGIGGWRQTTIYYFKNNYL